MSRLPAWRFRAPFEDFAGKLTGSRAREEANDCIAMTAKCPEADIARREALLSPLEHVHRETIGVNLTIHVGPKAIHLIALDTFDGHQWPS